MVSFLIGKQQQSLVCMLVCVNTIDTFPTKPYTVIISDSDEVVKEGMSDGNTVQNVLNNLIRKSSHSQ